MKYELSTGSFVLDYQIDVRFDDGDIKDISILDLLRNVERNVRELARARTLFAKRLRSSKPLILR